MDRHALSSETTDVVPTGWSIVHCDRHAGSPLQPPRQLSYAAHEGSAAQTVDSAQQLVFAHDAHPVVPYDSPQVSEVSASGGLSSMPVIWRHENAAAAAPATAPNANAPARPRMTPRRYHERRERVKATRRRALGTGTMSGGIRLRYRPPACGRPPPQVGRRRAVARAAGEREPSGVVGARPARATEGAVRLDSDAGAARGAVAGRRSQVRAGARIGDGRIREAGGIQGGAAAGRGEVARVQVAVLCPWVAQNRRVPLDARRDAGEPALEGGGRAVCIRALLRVEVGPIEGPVDPRLDGSVEGRLGAGLGGLPLRREMVAVRRVGRGVTGRSSRSRCSRPPRTPPRMPATWRGCCAVALAAPGVGVPAARTFRRTDTRGRLASRSKRTTDKLGKKAWVPSQGSEAPFTLAVERCASRRARARDASSRSQKAVARTTSSARARSVAGHSSSSASKRAWWNDSAGSLAADSRLTAPPALATFLVLASRSATVVVVKTAEYGNSLDAAFAATSPRNRLLLRERLVRPGPVVEAHVLGHEMP